MYGTAPHDSAKGIVRGVPLHFTEAEIITNTHQTEEIYGVSRLGQTTTVILTFCGCKKPILRTTPWREISMLDLRNGNSCFSTCHEVGHRSTASPHANLRVCHQCGIRSAVPDHQCSPTCGLVPHLSRSPGCTTRYAEPYILRQRRFRQARAACREPLRDPTPPRGRWRERPATPAS